MDRFEIFLAVTNGILGVGLFAVALYRAIRGRASPITYAANFVQAIGLIASVLGIVGVVQLETGLWTLFGLNIVSVTMLSAHKDPKRTGAVISGSI